MALEIDNLNQLFVEQLRDLYDAEQQIIQALPKLIEKCSNNDLKNALQQHYDITVKQISRLRQVFQSLGREPEGETCRGMQGIIAEGEGLLGKVRSPEVRDAGIITAAQRVEHYEIAGYGSAKTYARELGLKPIEQTLEEILNQEKEADQTLTGLAEGINIQAKNAA